MFNQGQDNNLKMDIKRFLIFEARDDYQDVIRRNFQLNLTAGDLDKLTELSHPGTVRSQLITPSIIATTVPNIISMSTMVGGHALIDYGWQTRRARFIIEADMEISGFKMSYYIQGYTSHLDITLEGTLDPSMIYYINSITELKKNYHPVTGQLMVTPSNTFNIIRGEDGGVIEMSTSRDYHELVRPCDIIHQMFNDEVYGDTGETVLTTNRLSSTKSSFKKNNNPLEYFTNTINALHGAKAELQDTLIMSDLLNNASVKVREYDIMNNVFIKTMYAVTGNPDPTKFKASELEMMCPNINHVTRTVLRDKQQIVLPDIRSMQILDSSVTESTFQPTYKNLKATMMSNIIPSIMSTCMLSKVVMGISNISHAGEEPMVTVIDARSLVDGLELIPLINRFQRLVRDSVLPILTSNNLSVVECVLDCNLLGDFTIELEIDGDGKTLYRLPLFADGLYSPVIASSDVKAGLQQDFDTLFNNNFEVMSSLAAGLNQQAAL